MDATVAAACPSGIKCVQAVGFVVIVNTRRGDYAMTRRIFAFAIYADLIMQLSCVKTNLILDYGEIKSGRIRCPHGRC